MLPPFPGTLFQLGSRGTNVRLIQETLNEIGKRLPTIAPLVADGIFGPLTQAAVIEFQRLFGLDTTGIVGPLTWAELSKQQSLITPPTCPPSQICQAPVCPPSDGASYFNYTVVARDTLWQLSQRFHTTVDTIMRLNNLTSTLLNIGQILRIPISMPRKRIALTFDDGPREETNQVLDALERYHVRATFFVLGELVKQGKSIIERAVSLGNEIAGHAWTHDDMRTQSVQEIAGQLALTSSVIADIVACSPPIARPPYGNYNDNVRSVFEQLGYSITFWSLDTLDWQSRDPEAIYSKIMNNVQNGDVILLHDIYPTTALAIERVLPDLLAQGYEFVTMSELLVCRYGQLQPGAIYSRG